jgi:CRISPR-associated protein (TIGR03986 family)
MSDSMKWTLQILQKKGRVSYRVSNGKAGFNVAELAICFRPEDATDGCAVQVETTTSGQPKKVTILGKSEVQPKTTPPPSQSGFRGQPDNRGGRGSPPSRQGAHSISGVRRERDEEPRRDATAPYNFVTAESPLAFADDPAEPRYSGTLACSGKALTPLLVASPQDRDAHDRTAVPERRFFTANGKPVIPGSSLKGMLRAVVESLSRAPMAGFVSDTKIGTRSVSEPESVYSMRFKEAITEQRLRAGFLCHRGADFFITPCKYVRVRLPEITLGRPHSTLRVTNSTSARQVAEQAYSLFNSLLVRFTIGSDTDSDGVPVAEGPALTPGGTTPTNVIQGQLVPTGGMALQHRRVKDKGYIFYCPDGENDEIHVADEAVQAFDDQRTKPQEDLLNFYQKNGLRIPVFYLVESDSIAAYGLCKYFRVPTQHAPADLCSRLPEETEDRAMSELLFGSVGNIPRRGRVRCSIGTFDLQAKAVRFPQQGNIVAGNPVASAVTMYLVQDNDRTSCRGRRNRFLISYDDDKPVLRGRKWYWHRHHAKAPLPPNENRNVQVVYHPLEEGASFEFHVAFDRLSLMHLGALLEAIDFPAGHAHKLGLGKPFGLGSVRLTINWGQSSIAAVRDIYTSLSKRLEDYVTSHKPGACLEAAATPKLAAEARAAFQAAVVSADKAASGTFEALPHVQHVRALTNWENPPVPDSINYMSLSDKNSPSATYADRPILDNPSGVRHRRPT